MSDEWIIGILSALLGAAGAWLTQRHLENDRKMRATRFEIYRRLLALNESYFYVASSVIYGERPPQAELSKCHTVSLEIADLLRSHDKLDYVEELAAVLFDESIPSSNERANRITELVDKYAALSNSTFDSEMRKISRSNVTARAKGVRHQSYAPGQWRPPWIPADPK